MLQEVFLNGSLSIIHVLRSKFKFREVILGFVLKRQSKAVKEIAPLAPVKRDRIS